MQLYSYIAIATATTVSTHMSLWLSSCVLTWSLHRLETVMRPLQYSIIGNTTYTIEHHWWWLLPLGTLIIPPSVESLEV